MEALAIRVEDGSPLVLHLSGELDVGSANQLRASLGELLSDGSELVVDMAGVEFVDASGLRPLLQAAEKLNGSGPLKLVNAPLVARLLELTGLAGTCSIEIRD